MPVALECSLGIGGVPIRYFRFLSGMLDNSRMWGATARIDMAKKHHIYDFSYSILVPSYIPRLLPHNGLELTGAAWEQDSVR